MKKELTDLDILIKGQLTVNLPIVIIMITIFLLLGEFSDFSLSKTLLISFLLGWISWGF